MNLLGTEIPAVVQAMDMTPIQIVIDTNVLVSAFRSRKGASYALLSRLHEQHFKINLSNAVVLEYEEKLKEELKRQGKVDMQDADRFLDYLLTIGNRCSIHTTLPVDDIHPDDQFVFDLAVAAEAVIIVTYNIRHFRGASVWGIDAMRPGSFLRLLEDRP